MSPPTTPSGPGLPAAILLYTAARLGLVAVVGAALVLAGVPFVIAVLVAIIVALPLSMVLFRGLRGRLDAALDRARRRRSAERDALRARLRGDDPGGAAASSGDAAQRQPERGEG